MNQEKGVHARRALAFAVLMLAAFATLGETQTGATHSGLMPVENPREATFFVDGQPVQLRNGNAERPAAPGSASTTRTRILGAPAYGDIDGDGDSDAVFYLVQDGGGSGTFYYVVVAHRVERGYVGGNALLLGDRIVPKRLDILQGVVVVEYLEHAPDQPMAAQPTRTRGSWFLVEDGTLKQAGTLGPGEQVVEGWIRFGHEVRTFEPCAEPRSYWLMGNSPALTAVRGAVRHAAAGAEPWPPQLLVLSGSRAEPPRDGFGANYDAGWQALQVIRVAAGSACRSDQIVLDWPVRDSAVTAPLSVRGRARGTWFFEGDFPVVLQDTHGHMLAQGVASAEGEWMTSEFVPFSATLNFVPPRPGRAGRLLLLKDNPSHRSELDDMLVVPVFFE